MNFTTELKYGSAPYSRKICGLRAQLRKLVFSESWAERVTAMCVVVIAGMLRILRSNRGHIFWSDEFSPLDISVLDASELLTSGQVTDSYLLALAASHNATLATFDGKINTKAVPNGIQHLHIIA